MQRRPLGKTGPSVSILGLGCMGMSGIYGPTDQQEAIATIDAALDSGITLLDTGDFYDSGRNELLLRDALRAKRREQIVLSVKFGEMRDPMGGWYGVDNRPKAIKNFLTYSLNRLDTDYIDIYRPARLDPMVPIEETIGAIAEMVSAGYVRYIGLSEVGSETIRRAATVHSICDLQIEYSLISRSLEPKVLPTCRELGIGITAYGVLSRGLLSGHWTKDRKAKGDARNRLPRFSIDNLDTNLALVDALRRVADSKGVTVAQVAIAWTASRGEDVFPVVGARRRDQLNEALGSMNLRLTAQELSEIEAAVPVGAAAGSRYAEPAMAHLDSER